MNPGLIVLIVVLIVRAMKRQGGGQGTRKTGGVTVFLGQEVSFRIVFRVVLFIVTYLVLAFMLEDLLPGLPIRLRSQWLIDIIQVAGSGIFLTVLLRCGPPWLAWRICRPLRLFFPGSFFYWFTLGAKKRESERFGTLMRVAQGKMSKHPPAAASGLKAGLRRLFLLKKTPPPFSPDAWTTATQALLSEIGRNSSRADHLLQAFDLCPPGMKTSRVLRRYAFEELAWHAAKRGDWEAVRHRARQGVGRGVRFLKLLAAMHLQHKVNRTVLLLAWMVSPLRLRSLPLVRPLLRRRADDGVKMPGPAQPIPSTCPRRTHLDLLYKASRGKPVSMEEVFLLAKRWNAQWTALDKENLLLRGMELRARDVLAMTQTIEETVLEELEELAAAADGAITEEIVTGMTDGDDSYAARLGWRIRNRLYDDMNRAQALFQVELFQLKNEQPLSEDEIQEYWENWLCMQATASRLCRILGTDELGTLWYGGLRNMAWNGAARIYNACGKRAAWIAIIMFYWVVTIAQRLGDEQAETVNRNNMTVCGYTAPGKFRSRLFRMMPRMRFRIRAKA
jgi:hypothetical protein